MDSQNLSPTLLKAGQEYLDALRKLRLNPEGLLWSRVNEIETHTDSVTGEPVELDGPSGDWHLVLVTGALDEGGPISMQELLFKAYDASATPKEISPFIVEVMSAKSPFVSHLINVLNNPFGPSAIISNGPDGKPRHHPVDNFVGQQMVAGLWFDRKWIYHLNGMKLRHAERQKRWREFKRSVNELAA